jgi:polyisoprenoid-binding protein YceI
MSHWQIDSAHSSVEFSVRHLMISTVRGRFERFTGQVQYEPGQAELASVEVAIEAASVNTNQAQRDAHLRSADFFDAEKYPSLNFVSKRVRATGKERAEIDGELTLHGVTLPVTLRAEGPTPPVVDPYGKRRFAVSAHTTVSRKDFGLTWNQVLEAGGVTVSDEVKITLDIAVVENTDAA